MAKSKETLFFEKVTELDSGCWEWMAYTNACGYGVFGVPPRGRTMLAHRWVYEFMIGEIPEGLVLDHLCRNRACVNPYHLEPVTHAVNMSRGSNATRTHCKHGHEYTSENTYIQSKGSRACVTCARQRAAEQHKRERAAS